MKNGGKISSNKNHLLFANFLEFSIMCSEGLRLQIYVIIISYIGWKQGRRREFVQGGGLSAHWGPENTLKSIVLTGSGGATPLLRNPPLSEK